MYFHSSSTGWASTILRYKSFVSAIPPFGLSSARLTLNHSQHFTPNKPRTRRREMQENKEGCARRLSNVLPIYLVDVIARRTSWTNLADRRNRSSPWIKEKRTMYGRKKNGRCLLPAICNGCSLIGYLTSHFHRARMKWRVKHVVDETNGGNDKTNRGNDKTNENKIGISGYRRKWKPVGREIKRRFW